MEIRHSKAEPLGRRKPPKVNRSEAAPETLDFNNPFISILDLAADAIVAVNVRKSIIFFNRSAEAVFGYSAREIYSKPIKILIRRGLGGLDQKQIMALDAPAEGRGRTREPLEVIARRKDGSVFPAQLSLSKIALGSETVLSLTLQDARSHAFTEERLRAAVREKEVLLEEVHHRVKNNLQVITSLLGL